MRSLTLDESIERVQSKASDVEYSDKKFFLIKLNLFWNFLESQPRLKNVLEKIEQKYSVIFADFPDISSNYTAAHKQAEKLFYQQTTEEELGAYGYCFIKAIKDDNSWSIPYEVTLRVFHGGSNYEELKDRFVEVIFNPFIALIVEILEDSRTDNLKDYFSKKEIVETEVRIDNTIDELTRLLLGQEVIFEELQDLKSQLQVLNKKNWFQLLQGKLYDLALAEIAKETINFIFKQITGTEMKLLQ